MRTVHQFPVYGDMILSALRRYPSRTAFIFENGELTYSQLETKLQTVVAIFKGLGLKRGDAIAQISLNRYEAVLIQFATHLLGLRLVPLHPYGSVEDHAFILEDSAAKAIVVDEKNFHDHGKLLLNRASLPKTILTFGECDYGASLEHLAKSAAVQPLTCESVPDDVISTLYTGGTTGRPKGIMLGNRSLVTNAWLMLSEWDLPVNPRFMCVTPITHASGVMITPLLMAGGCIILQESFEPEKFRDAILEYNANLTFLVPTMIYKLLQTPETEDHKLASLECILYGASPISPSRLRSAIERFGKLFTQIYAQAESPNMGVIMYRNEHDLDVPDRLTACGRPLAGTTVCILNEDGTEVEPGEPGEVCFRGPVVMDGYWNRPEETEKAMPDGWLHTGDIARMDEQGFLHIVDRKKEMIVTGGLNVYPKEVEDAIMTHPAVSFVSVIGVPDEIWGETVKAVVVLRDEHKATEQEIISFTKSLKGSVSAPKLVDFVNEIPLTNLGKPDKKLIRSWYWTDKDRAVH